MDEFEKRLEGIYDAITVIKTQLYCLRKECTTRAVSQLQEKLTDSLGEVATTLEELADTGRNFSNEKTAILKKIQLEKEIARLKCRIHRKLEAKSPNLSPDKEKKLYEKILRQMN